MSGLPEDILPEEVLIAGVAHLKHKFQNRCPVGVVCMDGVGRRWEWGDGDILLEAYLRHNFQNRCPMGVCFMDGVGLGLRVG